MSDPKTWEAFGQSGIAVFDEGGGLGQMADFLSQSDRDFALRAAREHGDLVARVAELEAGLRLINSRASPNPTRTAHVASKDLEWITDHARALLNKDTP